MRALLYPTENCIDGSDPKYLSFSIDVNYAAFRGWVKQPSPCCCAAASAGAWNTSLRLTRPSAAAYTSEAENILPKLDLESTVAWNPPRIRSLTHKNALTILVHLLSKRIQKSVERFIRLLGVTAELELPREIMTSTKRTIDSSSHTATFERQIYGKLYPLIIALRNVRCGLVDVDPSAPKRHSLTQEDIEAGLKRGKKIKGPSRKKLLRGAVHVVWKVKALRDQITLEKLLVNAASASASRAAFFAAKSAISSVENAFALVYESSECDISFHELESSALTLEEEEERERLWQLQNDCFSALYHASLSYPSLFPKMNGEESDDVLEEKEKEDSSNEETSSEKDKDDNVDEVITVTMKKKKKKTKSKKKTGDGDEWTRELAQILHSARGLWKVSEALNPRPSTAAFGNWGVVGCLEGMNRAFGGNIVSCKTIMGKGKGKVLKKKKGKKESKSEKESKTKSEKESKTKAEKESKTNTASSRRMKAKAYRMPKQKKNLSTGATKAKTKKESGWLSYYSVSKNDSKERKSYLWAQLRALFARPGSALVGHWKNHYALIFAMRQWEETIEEVVEKKEEENPIRHIRRRRVIHREVLTARKGQRPQNWIDFNEIHDMMCRWFGHKIMLIVANDDEKEEGEEKNSDDEKVCEKEDEYTFI
eukprot:g480.t1